ncbi:oligoendopeptidase F [Caldalkalibacillus salinus]|uniref:oligoendopeptidase F n=1 Tax=Caldalkalibacillus salinus TaxID=2803787 RepID=UPI0019216DA1|nr:oligoendopeptidase F [Caldalkalibacillus salinus]
MEKRLLRDQVPESMTWNLQDLFETEHEWEGEINQISQDLPMVTQYQGRLAEDPKTLLNCLEAEEKLSIRLMRVATYANLRSSEDGTNPTNQANASRVAALVSTVSASLAFIRTEILEMPEETLRQYIAEEDGLDVYSKSLNDMLEEKPYRLSAETEEVLASLSEIHNAPYMIYQRAKLSDMQFNDIRDASGQSQPMSFALFEDKYEFSPDTELRRNAYASFVHTLQQYKHTIAATYATEVKKQVNIAKLRGYESVTDMLLQPQQVSKEMYHNQLDIIQRELAPHMRRLAKLKQRVLGLDKMTFVDLKAPLDPEYNPSTTFEEASATILEALQVMGTEYTDIMERGLKERWVDLADNVGKSTGAFCSSPYGVHPYILVTWTDTMRGVFTLAHELGHAGHFYLAGQHQSYGNTRPSRYFVEAPSTMNELLLGQHILSQTDDARMKRWVILQFLGTYYHNFVTHLLEGELQRRVYQLAEEGQPITASTLSEQKRDLLQNFWGDTVDIDEGASLTWMRQPHYYMGLYPYTYSAGLTASTAVAQLFQREGQPAIDRWLEVLKAGGTMKPLELMKYAGVDMSQPEPIHEAVAYVGTLVDELEKSFTIDH